MRLSGDNIWKALHSILSKTCEIAPDSARKVESWEMRSRAPAPGGCCLALRLFDHKKQMLGQNTFEFRILARNDS